MKPINMKPVQEALLKINCNFMQQVVSGRGQDRMIRGKNQSRDSGVDEVDEADGGLVDGSGGDVDVSGDDEVDEAEGGLVDVSGADVDVSGGVEVVCVLSSSSLFDW